MNIKFTFILFGIFIFDKNVCNIHAATFFGIPIGIQGRRNVPQCRSTL